LLNFDAFSVYEGNHYQIDPEKCRECDRCVDACPLDLIVRDESTSARRRFTEIRIDAEKCIGCSICQKTCPIAAISGVKKQPFVIDETRCIKCGACAEKCKTGAFIIKDID